MALSAKLVKLSGKGLLLLAALIASALQRASRNGGAVSIKTLKGIDPNSSSCMVPRDRIREFNGLAKQYGIPYHIVKDDKNLHDDYGIVFPYRMSGEINTILSDHMHLNELPREEAKLDVDIPHMDSPADTVSFPDLNSSTQFDVMSDGGIEMHSDGYSVMDGERAIAEPPSVRKQLMEHNVALRLPAVQDKVLLPEERPSIRLLLQEIKQQRLLPGRTPGKTKQKEGVVL